MCFGGTFAPRGPSNPKITKKVKKIQKLNWFRRKNVAKKSVVELRFFRQKFDFWRKQKVYVRKLPKKCSRL